MSHPPRAARQPPVGAQSDHEEAHLFLGQQDHGEAYCQQLPAAQVKGDQGAEEGRHGKGVGMEVPNVGVMDQWEHKVEDRQTNPYPLRVAVDAGKYIGERTARGQSDRLQKEQGTRVGKHGIGNGQQQQQRFGVPAPKAVSRRINVGLLQNPSMVGVPQHLCVVGRVAAIMEVDVTQNGNGGEHGDIARGQDEGYP